MSLNIESCYSLNGSLLNKDSLPYFKESGYSSLALVDTTTAFYLPFYWMMKSMDIKPILGYRVKGMAYDVILYAKNFEGYKNILYYASSINNQAAQDFNYLIHSENLIYCIDVSHYESINTEAIDKLYNALSELNLDVYLGVDFNYYPCEVMVYPVIKDHYKMIIISKVKYLREKDKKASEVLEAILTNKELKEANLFDMDNISSDHLRNKDEILNQYKDYPELLKETEAFTDKIDLNIEYSKCLPKYETKDNTPSDVYLKLLSTAGLKRRLLNTSKNYNLYKERLDYELSVIHSMGFDDYFLVVYDYILYAKKNGIYVGPGRGSGASSLVSYSLGIIDIDPIEYNLYFERFLNPSRKTMPDIDTDFEDTRRDDVIEYCSKKYGEYHVSLISTYQTFQAKSAINEIGKILNISDLKLAMLSREIGSENAVTALLDNMIVKNYYDNDSEYKELIDIALSIEGLPRSIGCHASGVIISDKDLREYSEVHIGNMKFIQTTYDADVLEEIGLLKMDFLSLKNLSTIHEMVNDVKENEKVELNLAKINLNDAKTFKLLREKSTLGIFQLESPGMNDLIKKMKVNNFLDLSVCLALYRPGPMKNIPEYLKRREGNVKIDYYDKCLESTLKETYGIIIYQEQLMAIVKEYSGFSLAEADILRRAISSKDINLIEGVKEKFFNGAEKLKRDPKTTERLYKDILRFADYGFNKSHSIAYARVAYYLAYIKANYPKEFMISLLKTQSNPKYIKECKALGVNVLPPDIRFSSYKYTVVNGDVYMPFTVIKGIGYEYASKINEITRNTNLDFESVIRKFKEVLPRTLVEDLIMADAFDYTGYNKCTMVKALDGIYDFDPSLVKNFKYKVKIQDEYDFDYLKNKEAGLLGFNYKYHPLKAYKGDLMKLSDLKLGTENIHIVGYLSGLRTLKTKTNDTMAQFTIEDEYISSKAVLFPRDYYSCAHYLENNKLYELTGSYKENRGEPQIVVRAIKKIEE